MYKGYSTSINYQTVFFNRGGADFYTGACRDHD